MQLVDLKYNFLELSSAEQEAAFQDYYERREIDMAKPPTVTKRKGASAPRKKKGKTITLSQSQLELLQKLRLV